MKNLIVSTFVVLGLFWLCYVAFQKVEASDAMKLRTENKQLKVEVEEKLADLIESDRKKGEKIQTVIQLLSEEKPNVSESIRVLTEENKEEDSAKQDE